jgi:hypothetical protein
MLLENHLREHTFYSACTVVCMSDMKNVYKILVGDSEWKRPLGRYRHRSPAIELVLTMM